MVARVRDWGLVIAAGSLVMVMIYIGWMTLIDGTIYQPVLEFGSRFGNVFPPDKTVYKPGDVLKIRMIVHKNRNITGKANWKLIDSTITAIPCQEASLPQGVHDIFVPILTIPHDMASGEYYLAGIVDYKVNWLRTIHYGLYSRKFTIVNDHYKSKSQTDELKNCPDYHVYSEEFK